MVIEDAQNRVLEYLKKAFSTNTFRLARDLGIRKNRLLDTIENIEAKPKKFLLPRINFAELNRYIQQLHVPEMLRKNV